MATIDTSGLVDGVNALIQAVFTYAPIGIAILAPAAAIVIGLGFGQKIVGFIKGAFGAGR